jgi:EAL domain-containing protein (putative c-di-GMP-specific phosphodiesterase class I)
MEALLDLATDLDSAVAEGELSAVFQPQISLATGRVVAAEGLCRWNHPRLGSVPPDQFIPLAEANGSIHAIGQFMIDECIAAADRWSTVVDRIEMSVNVSPLQLTASFADDLRERWGHRHLPMDSLTLEITESLPVTDLEAIVPRLEALREVGIGISLDDYGTGHASITQLDRLPVTEVKLDRSLIQAAADEPTEVSAVVGYAHARDLRVVAEGIENEGQLAFARDSGCDRAQGYLLGRPMPVEQLEALLVG